MKYLQKVQGELKNTTILLQFRTFCEVTEDNIFKSNNVMDQEHADFSLLFSTKHLYMQTILETVFEKGKKRVHVL